MTHKASVSPDTAMKLLKEGNARFAACSMEHPNLSADRRTSTATSGQAPFAAVLSCSDSRVPVELMFDRGIGDIFVVRVAGNIVGSSELASIKYAVHALETPILAVLGHTKCGAVTAVVQSGLLDGNLRALSERILPAVELARAGNPGMTPDELVSATVKANVWLAIQDALKSSECLRRRIKREVLKVVGGVYDIQTGKIHWMGTHPDQGKLLE